MRIERRYTTEARGPYEGIAFREALTHDSGRPAFAATVPKTWSDEAAAALARTCFARSGVPARLRRLEEPGIPAVLRRSGASETLMADLAEADRFAGEADARQFFDRFAGSLAYAGWKSGYFDGESDARAFADELRFMLAAQMAAPDAVLAHGAGLAWAYGIAAPPAEPRPESGEAAYLTVPSAPEDSDAPAIDAEDAATAAAAGEIRLRFGQATQAWRTCPDAPAVAATLDLLAFRNAAGAFDAPGLQHAVRLWTIALDIATAAQRPGEVGSCPPALGCANLGGLLAATALPYDSPRARAMAAAILALMTGTAYAAGAEIAAELGPSESDTERSAALLAIVADHRRALQGSGAGEDFPRGQASLDRAACPDEMLLGRADRAFDAAVERGGRNGFRNAGVTAIAEGGLAASLLELETVGIAPHGGPTRVEEPLGPAARRELWPSLREALRTLRYREAEIAEIEALAASGAAGAPLRPEHAALLAAADHAAQMRMAAAVQPFVSGDVGLTVGLPSDAGTAEFQAAATLARRLGLETTRLVRLAAPPSTPPAEPEAADGRPNADRSSGDRGPRDRQPLPDRRTGYTRKISAGGHEAYLHTGEYADGSLGEVFIDMHREDAAFRGLMDEFSSAVSLGLQHGVPLEEFVETFVRDNCAAERDPAFILDAVFRDLAASYLGRTDFAAEPPERRATDRGRGRGSGRGWRLPMSASVRPSADHPTPVPAPEAHAEPASLRSIPKLPRTDAFPLDRLTRGRGGG